MALIDLLPEYYKNSPAVVTLQGAFDYWDEALRTAREDFIAQMNVDSATWGLVLWERELGLSTDVSKPNDYRRTRIKSKLRGAGTTTKALIQSVSESFSNGEVEVTEYPDEYRFSVTFVSTIGIPPNMDDLYAAIEEIKPAHLAVTYVFIYRTNAELAPYTHTDLAAYTHETLRSGVMT